MNLICINRGARATERARACRFHGEAAGFRHEAVAVGSSMYELLDEQMRLLRLPQNQLNDFCRKSGREIHPTNLKQLLAPELHQSRLGWESKMVKGLRLLTAVKWIKRVGYDDDEPVPVPDWDAEGFIEKVALKRDDMAGLRSKKNLTSFIRRSKIKGTVLTVYGVHKAYCPAGWRLVVKPANYTDLLVHAPAWDTVSRLAAPSPPPLAHPPLIFLHAHSLLSLVRASSAGRGRASGDRWRISERG